MERYVTGVQDSVRAMKLQGYELVKVVNGWKGEKGNYKGLNLTWRDPETGHLFELQFHTPDSFWINKSEHFTTSSNGSPTWSPAQPENGT